MATRWLRRTEPQGQLLEPNLGKRQGFHRGRDVDSLDDITSFSLKSSFKSFPTFCIKKRPKKKKKRIGSHIDLCCMNKPKDIQATNQTVRNGWKTEAWGSGQVKLFTMCLFVSIFPFLANLKNYKKGKLTSKPDNHPSLSSVPQRSLITAGRRQTEHTGLSRSRSESKSESTLTCCPETPHCGRPNYRQAHSRSTNRPVNRSSRGKRGSGQGWQGSLREVGVGPKPHQEVP